MLVEGLGSLGEKKQNLCLQTLVIIVVFPEVTPNCQLLAVKQLRVMNESNVFING